MPLVQLAGVGIAAAGSDLLTASERLPEVVIDVDISALSMAAAGADVLRPEERPAVVPVQVDISGMSMAPVGANLEQARLPQRLVNPDISHLKLAP